METTENGVNERLEAARRRAEAAEKAEAARWRRTPAQEAEVRQAIIERERLLHERHVEAGKRAAAVRWAGHTKGPMVTCKVYEGDLRVLRELRGYGFRAVAEIVHRLIEHSEGLFWTRCASPFNVCGWSAKPISTFFERPQPKAPDAGESGLTAGGGGA